MSFTATASDIAKLRATTGAGMMDCKQALEESEGDQEKAADWLRKKGILKAAKRADKVAAEGAITSYIHGGGKIGVLVEVNCETDFVAKTDGFRTLTNDIAMHIAASAPRFVARADVPAEIIEREKQIYRDQMAAENKPADMMEKALEGKLAKFYREVCLLEQPFIKDEEKTVEQLLGVKTGEIGEKISIRRFVRYELGEGIEKVKTDFAAEVAEQLK